MLAYIDELSRIGGYGKGRSGVIKRFVENGIARELRRNILKQNNADDMAEKEAADDDEG